MLLFALLLIKPEPGEFRTKITSIASEIKAYTLLERNKTTQNIENFTIKQCKIEFKPAPERITPPNTQRHSSNLIDAIKSNQQLYANYGQIEIAQGPKNKNNTN